MISLAMDTAGTACSVCLYDGDSATVIAALSEELGKGHAERLMGMIAHVMDEADVSYGDIDKITTTIGPGSFAGIRVGVATARGLGLGLGVPVVGVNNLEALMLQASRLANLETRETIAVLMNAGRGQVFAQFGFDTDLAGAHEPIVAETPDIISGLNALAFPYFICGNASATIASELEGKFEIIEGCEQADISIIAQIGAERSEAKTKPEPLYLRKPDATPQVGFAVERLD